MSILDKLKHMALSRGARLRLVEELLVERSAELAGAGCVVIAHGVEQESVMGAPSTLPAWITYYDADPDLEGLMQLRLESYRGADGMVLEPAHANVVEEHEPSRHLLLADLEVHERRRRNHFIGTRLVQAAKTIAAERGLPLYGNLSDVDEVERLLPFYRRLGFETEIFEASSGLIVGQIRWTPVPPTGSSSNATQTKADRQGVP